MFVFSKITHGHCGGPIYCSFFLAFSPSPPAALHTARTSEHSNITYLSVAYPRTIAEHYTEQQNITLLATPYYA